MNTSVKILILSICIIGFSCFSDSERADAEVKLIEEGVLKSDEALAKEVEIKRLLHGKWQTVKARFVNSGQVLPYTSVYNSPDDYVEIMEFDDKSNLKSTVINEYYKNHSEESNVKEYFYEVYDNKISKEVLKQGVPTGTLYYYDIITLTKDSLVLRIAGKELKNTEYIEEENPFVSFHVRIK